ncbi:MAG: VCBS repeat-containing protein [Acidobacteria bacterium]|nr:MAG: VCBS repeat-containing protein [Acidobacteriota bacterium]REJ97946.1 MAG: VCBS repeat-containing protein [Acidobacteriota bacterium]REK16689.1 MAG: VCBS repeat-containing protein [Acidobacteriota bacterium]REK42600.1 MAG: VCBS repeat-containing protein [Acidobacteriota bacterium]
MSDMNWAEFWPVRQLIPTAVFLHFLFAFATAQPCVMPVFSGGKEFPVGNRPQSIALGDVDNDNDQDVVVANLQSNDVAVLRNNGGGGFLPAISSGADIGPLQVVLKDLNNDQFLDAVVLSRAVAKVSILLGNGDGSFSPGEQLQLIDPAILDIADFDEDGQWDIGVLHGSFFQGKMSVFTGVGNGTFHAPVDTMVTNGVSFSLAVADFDQDGVLDFVSGTNGLIFYKGNGKGGFERTWSIVSSQGGVVAGHLNEDQIPDIAAFNSSGDRVHALIGNGDGSFRRTVEYRVGEVVQRLAIGDLNNDGRNDIVTSNFASNEVSILIGTGSGYFKPPIFQVTSGEPRDLALHDFDGDDVLDVVSTSGRNGSIALTLGKGDGTFRAPSTVKIFNGAFPNMAAVTDVNNDGRADVISANSGGYGVTVFLRKGDYSFHAQKRFLQNIYVNYLTVDDFNNDGEKDIFSVGLGTGQTLLGNGAGSFTALPTFQTLPGGGFAVYVGSEDFNGDGKKDIVVSDRDVQRFVVWFGQGDGTFNQNPAIYLSNGRVLRGDIADFNRDGRPDLVFAVDTSGDSIIGRSEVRINSGNGTFPVGTEFNIGVSKHPYSVIADDFNNDAKIDFAVTVDHDATMPGHFRVYMGNGSGSFSSGGIFNIGGNSSFDIVAHDFNRDGKKDLATTANITEEVKIFEGTGTGSFVLRQSSSGGDQPRTLSVGNLNADSSADLLAMNYNAGSLTIFPNECAQAFEFTSSGYLDFDGDGITDIAVFRPNSLPASQWWLLRSSDQGTRGLQFGSSTDIPVVADYTGDGRSDIAFWRPSSGEWYILRSEDDSFFAFPFGAKGDIPAPGDFDGDGKADPAVYRPSSGTWFILSSSNGQLSVVPFGVASDRPIVADYDGDGIDDVGVYRPSENQFWLLRSFSGLKAYQFGASGDRTTIGDWTGDGKADVAFFRPSTSEWFVIRSEDDSFFAFPWGAPGDVPSPGDFDGDGKFDPVVWRPSDRTWYIFGSTNGFQAINFGANGDVPLPSSVSVN